MRIKNFLKNKAGSFTIYAMFFATSVISLITLLISSAENELVKTGAYSLGSLWANSILGEYDKPLYDEYGIFGFYGDEGLVENKLQFYVDYTFGDKRYARCDVERVDLYDYSLGKTDILLKQIRTVATEDTISAVLLNEDDPIRFSDEEGSGGTPRVISNESTIRSLPSYGRAGNGLLDRASEFIKSFTSVKDIIKNGTDEFLINKYITCHFRNIYYTLKDHNSYLYGEQEYIIGGRYSDEQNRKSVRNRIIAMREVMNTMYIESNPEMQEKILAAGAVVTAGYAPEEAAAVITAAWALAESVNDYELLIRGKPVPVFKDESSWAISLDNVINNKASGCIDTGNESGDKYNDYIVYLLCLLDDETKLLRIMDLIQINLRYTYRDDFLIKEHYAGLNYYLRANGDFYEFREEY